MKPDLFLENVDDLRMKALKAILMDMIYTYVGIYIIYIYILYILYIYVYIHMYYDMIYTCREALKMALPSGDILMHLMPPISLTK